MNYEQIIQSRANYADDAAFLAWANTPVVQRLNLIELWQIKLMMVEAGIWTAFQNPQNPVAVAFMDLYSDPRFDHLDMTLPVVQQLLGGAMQTGLLTADQAATMQNIGAVSSYPLGSIVTQADIDAARLAEAREALRIKLQTAFNAKLNEIDAMTEVTATDVEITLK